MLRVALTGGLCCGKSTVAAMLAQLGCPVIDADQIANRLLQPGTAASARVTAQFGEGMLRDDGGIDRARLAARVFADENARRTLNGILHPLIIEEIDRELDALAHQGRGLAVVEAALFVEEGLYRRFDRLIVVTCDAEQKIARFEARTAGTREQALARINAQLPDEEKAHVADFVIDNSGPLERTRKQVEDVYASLRAASTSEVA